MKGVAPSRAPGGEEGYLQLLYMPSRHLPSGLCGDSIGIRRSWRAGAGPGPEASWEARSLRCPQGAGLGGSQGSFWPLRLL